jgi:hypothetical protein
MKKLILAAFALTAAVSVFAQGTVFWQSYSGDGIHTYHYWGPSASNPGLTIVGAGVNDVPAGSKDYAASGMSMIGANGLTGKYGASTTFAQLLWANGAGAPEASLVPGGQTTTFRSGGAATGLLVSVVGAGDIITGLTPDSAAATFEMVAWDNSSGLYPTWTQASSAWNQGLIAAGKSGAFTVNAIGGSVNTAPSAMAPSFNLFMVPEPSTFALAGLGAAALMIFRRRK